MEEYILSMNHISKSFPGVQALNDVSLHVKKGSVHALMGENGAGKSTLMKCLFGLYKKDVGDIVIEGENVEIKGTHDALKYGIAMVHQELLPILERSIAENIYCGRYPTYHIGPFHFVDYKKMKGDTKYYLNELGLDFNPDMKLKELSVSQMQSVEIAKAISFNAKVIIMDEPTSSLTQKEVESLFGIIRKLKSQGVSIIYISHKMEEILTIADEVTIMRDGNYIGTWKSKELTTDIIIKKMVGRVLDQRYPLRNNVPSDVIFKVENLTSSNPKLFKDVSFELKKGEILGIGGLVGARRSELVEAIYKIRNIKSGNIYYKGELLNIHSPKDAIEKGIALLTEDRRATGIFQVLSVLDNVSVASYDKYLHHKYFIDKKGLEDIASDNIQKMNIKTPSLKTHIQSLSGGNQQKVIIARWLANNPDILILDEPTRGIDVGAKYEIYCIIADLAAKGKSIIMISSEMSELIGMSDRIMVMCEGRVTGFVDSRRTSQEEIMTLATQYM